LDEKIREGMKYGLTDEEMKDPYEAMFSGGVMKMWNARQAIIAGGQMADGEDGDEETLYDKDYEEVGKDEAAKRQKERERRRQRMEELLEVPLWQQISGLFPETEEGMNPNERAGGILALIKKVEGMLRYEIKFAREHPVEFRTYLWDPLRVVCFHLGISQQRLSRYCKELTGMSAMEMVDRMKAEGVRGKLKEELRKFIKLTAEELKDGETGGRGDGEKRHDGEGADAIFLALKKSRRDGRWHRTTWAMGLGFSSYQRFFRACLLCFGKTPHEVEMELIEEILKEVERTPEGAATGTAVAVRKSEGEEQRGEKREVGVSVT
jgi:AraC-like DNA-binding protein